MTRRISSTRVQWQRHSKNSQAEVDYISSYRQTVLPIEVKAGTQGGMKSLWGFMREKHLSYAVRCSMERFSSYDYVDNEDESAIRKVLVCPVYAVSRMGAMLKNLIAKDVIQCQQ